MKKVRKEMTVVSPEDAKERLGGMKFGSFRAVARKLESGESVVVAVHESLGKLMVFTGYGEVKRIDETRWVEPRRLLPDI